MQTEEHYLDNSATTPVLREAAEAASRLMLDCFGNPSSLHTRGFLAKKELDAARAVIAARGGGGAGGKKRKNKKTPHQKKKKIL